MQEEIDNIQKRNDNTPKAILVTFFATFISLLVTFSILLLKNNSIGLITSQNGNINIWILVLVYSLVTRHHLRVIFLDTVYIKIIEKNYEKIIIWLLLLIAIMGSITFIISGFGIKVLSIFMIVYTFFFLALGIFMLAGRLTEPDDKNNLNAVYSVFLDIVCLASWFIIFFSEETTGYFILCISVLVMISSEFMRIFKEPFIKRIKEFRIEVQK